MRLRSFDQGPRLRAARFVQAAGALALCGALLCGCAALLVGGAAGAGAATVAYTQGDLETTLAADPRAVEKACKATFGALELKTISSAATALDAEIIGRTAADTRIRVTAKTQGGGECRVSIRAGTFGDEAMSRRILDEIRQRLPEASRRLAEEPRAETPYGPSPEAPDAP